MVGYYQMARGWMDHPAFGRGPYSRREAWCWLIEKAAWRETRVDIAGKIVTLKRGQLSYSVRYLAEAWRWKKHKTELFIGRLKTETMIGTDKGAGRLVITICNYEKYQTSAASTGTAEGTEKGTRRGQEGDSRGTNKKNLEEVNKENKKKDIPPVEAEFLDWYATYPLHKGRKAALKAYLLARKEVPAADLLAGAQRYATAMAGTESRYVAHGATWLNQGRWNDEYRPDPDADQQRIDSGRRALLDSVGLGVAGSGPSAGPDGTVH